MISNRPLMYYLAYKIGLQPALTQTTESERHLLTKYARDKSLIVEIGVWHGVNTLALRNVMSQSGVLYAIDPFESNGKFGRSWQKPIAHSEVNKSRNGTVVWLEDYSHQAIHRFKEITSENTPIDFIFIDGDHSYKGLKADWELWSPLVKFGGTVALHDSRSYENRQIDNMGSVQFTQEVIIHDRHFQILDTRDSLTVLEKVSPHE